MATNVRKIFYIIIFCMLIFCVGIISVTTEYDCAVADTNTITAVGGSITYSYTGGAQSFIVSKAGYYTFEAWGAQGGDSLNILGGRGGYCVGTIYLDAGTTLYVYVGEAGTRGGARTYNGGGLGANSIADVAGSGGGATDIRVEGGSWNSTSGLRSRIFVAGGGGGGDSWGSGSAGGAGGGLVGGAGGYSANAGASEMTASQGGAQSSGGAGAWSGYADGNTIVAENGTFGVGADHGHWASGVHEDHYGGAGGGGWYGGGSGTHGSGVVGSGAGGSSYISGYDGCVAITTTGNHIETSVSPEGYSFFDCSMEQGKRAGNGQAKITLSYTSFANNTANFAYVGRYQTFTIPYTGLYQLNAWGASGGNVGNASGGAGGYTSGTIKLAKGTTLFIYVGQIGGSSLTNAYNGGGAGSSVDAASGGGGATDFRLIGTTWSNTKSLQSRIMVAGAGGGATPYSTGASGGAGGGLTGGAGSYSTSGSHSEMTAAQGGTQTSGGTGGWTDFNDGHGAGYSLMGRAGSFGIGANYGYWADGSASYGGGGGGGWYGGGGATHGSGIVGSGAGGSSYINGYSGCNTAYKRDGYDFTNCTIQQGGNVGNGKASIVFLGSPKSYESATVFRHNGSCQTFTAPHGGYYLFETWGAQGGNSLNRAYGGLGGYSAGYIYLAKGQTIYVYVGEMGRLVADQTAFNGGGSGGVEAYSVGGGGATDIRTESGAWNSISGLRSRFMVAGGGGGSEGYHDVSSNGGYGGGLTGGSAGYTCGSNHSGFRAATGGTQTSGGVRSWTDYDDGNGSGTSILGNDGAFGVGANHGYWAKGATSTYGGGGGGGYYGGAGGTHGSDIVGSGAGGSSFVSGLSGCNAVNASGSHTGQANHFSGYVFENAVTMSGVNNGNGKAIITLVIKDDDAPTSHTATAARNAGIYYNSVEVSTSATDSATGIDHYEYRIGTSGSFTNGNKVTVSSSLTTGTEEITVYFRAYDKAKNYSEITKTIKFDRTNYSISYELNNGENNASNTATTYNVESNELTFGDPTKAGFAFGGWYKESSFTNAITKIPTQSQGNVTLNAKWTINAIGKPTKSSDVDVTYSGSSSALSVTASHDAVSKTFTYEWYKDGEAIASSNSASWNVTAVADSGKYKCKVTVTSDGQSSSATSDEIDVKIAKAATTIDVSGVQTTYNYNGSLQTVNSGATFNHSETSPVYSNNTFTTVAEGNGLKVAITTAETANYLAGSNEVTLTVNKIDYDMSGVTFTNLSVEYDGQEHVLVVKGTLPTGLDSVQVTVSYSDNTFTNAMTATEVTATFATESGNYNTPTAKTATIEITKATYDMSGITFVDDSFTYDGSVHSLVISGTLPTGLDGTQVTVSYDGEATHVADGSVLVTASFTGTANYNDIDSKTAYVSIDAYELSISPSDFGKTFGESDSTITEDVDGTNSETVTLTYTRETGDTAGKYDLLTISTENTDYNVSFVSNANLDKYTIEKADITLTFTSASGITYGQKLSDSTITATAVNGANNAITPVGSFAWGDDTIMPSVSDSNKTEYEIVFTASDLDNYNAPESIVGKLTVGKATYDMTGISLTGEEFTYDGQSHTITIVGTLPTGLDEIQVTVSYEGEVTHVSEGTVTVTATFSTQSGNYETPTELTAEIKINAYELEITPKSFSKHYGETEPELTEDIETGVNDETIAVSYTRETGETVGKYDLLTLATENSDYSLSFKSGEDAEKLTIEKTTPTISGSITYSAITYGDTLADSTINGTYINPYNSAEVAGAWAWSDDSIVPKAYGTDEYEAGFTVTDGDNYDSPDAVSLAVLAGKASYDMSGVTFSDAEFEYNGTKQHQEIVGTLPTGLDDIQVEVEYIGYCLNYTGESVSIRARFTTDSQNYSAPSEMRANAIIKKCEITITIDNKESTYGDDLVDLTWQDKDGKIAGKDDLKIVLAKEEGSIPAKYEITGVYENTNYDATFVNGEYEITKRPITVTANAINVTYGDDRITTYTYDITDGDLVGSDTLGGTLSCPGYKAVAGEYEILQGSLGNPYYTITYESNYYTIGKKTISATIAGKESVYGESLAELTWSLDDGSTLAYQEAISVLNVALTKEEGLTVGEYEITAEYNNANYNLSFTNGNYEITKRAITVTAVGVNKTYGDEIVDYFEYTISAGNLVIGDLLSGGLSAPECNGNAGAYAILQGTLDNANYEITYVPAIYNIAKKSLTITANDVDKVYGETLLTDSELTYKVVGLVEGDTLGGTLACEDLIKNIGEYDILEGTIVSKNNANYEITFNKSTYTITKLTYSVTPKAFEKVYGSADPTFAENIVTPYDTIEVTYTREAGEDVGSFALCALETTNENYELSFKTGTNANKFTIKPYQLKVSPKEFRKGKGKEDPTLSEVFNGVNAEKVTVMYTRDKSGDSEEEGEYDLLTVVSLDGNYEASFVPGSNTQRFVITVSFLKVSVRNTTTTYGSDAPKYSADISGFNTGDGSEVYTGTLVFNCAYAKGSDAGEYEITASGITSAEYVIEFVPGVLTVNKKMLTITVDNGSITYGDKVPTCALRYSGFVLGDTEADLDANYYAGTTYEAAPSAGEHEIYIVGSHKNTNYVATTQNGNLHVAKRKLVLDIDDREGLEGDPLLPLSFTIVEGTLADYDTEDDIGVVLYKVQGSIGGRYDIKGKNEGKNYDILFYPGVYTIRSKTVFDYKTGVSVSTADGLGFNPDTKVVISEITPEEVKDAEIGIKTYAAYSVMEKNGSYSGNVVVSLKVPEELAGEKEVQVIIVGEDGKTRAQYFTVDSLGKISFTTTTNTRFMFAGSEAEGTSEVNSTITDNPEFAEQNKQNNDTMTLAISLSVAGLVLVGTVLLIAFKRGQR